MRRRKNAKNEGGGDFLHYKKSSSIFMSYFFLFNITALKGE